MPRDPRYAPLQERVMKLVNENKHLHEISIKLYEKGWTHLDTNPFRVADQLNTYMIQQGIYERGSLRIKVRTEANGNTIIILTFPLPQSTDGRDDPDVISLFDR
jgi:hypothetical protein